MANATTHAAQPAHDHAHTEAHQGGLTPMQREQQLRDHEAVFSGFMRWVTWTVVVSLAVVVFLALTNA